jgi:hypothetical protein
LARAKPTELPLALGIDALTELEHALDQRLESVRAIVNTSIA